MSLELTWATEQGTVSLSMVAHICDSALGRLRQEDQKEFKANLTLSQ